MVTPWNFNGNYQAGLDPALINYAKQMQAAYAQKQGPAMYADPGYGKTWGYNSNGSLFFRDPTGRYEFQFEDAPAGGGSYKDEYGRDWYVGAGGKHTMGTAPQGGYRLIDKTQGEGVGAAYDSTGKFTGSVDINHGMDASDMLVTALVGGAFGAGAMGYLGGGAGAAGGSGAIAGGAGTEALLGGAGADTLGATSASTLGGGAATAAGGGGSSFLGSLASGASSLFNGGGGMSSWLGPAASLAGAVFSGNAASDAAGQSAQAQLESARMSAEAAKFRPVGITNRFGSSNFNFDDKGYLSGAQYTLSPELQSIQNDMLSRAGYPDAAALTNASLGASSLMNLGKQYLATSPQQAAQSWMVGQQNLLAPSRERQLAQVRQGLFNTGRGGLAVGATGARPDGSAGLGAANPEMEAYFNAIAQQDAGLAAQATAEGRAQTQFGAGLFGNALDIQTKGYQPMSTSLGLAQTVDNLGQSSLDLGAQLGGRAASSGAQVGSYLMQGGLGAARTMQQANAYSPWGSALQGFGSNPQLMNGIGGMFSNYFSPQYVNTGTATGADMSAFYA